MRFRSPSADAVLVVGLGRFGSALATTLVELGHEVLAVDRDTARVQEWSDALTHVVQADATDAAVLAQLGAEQFPRAVVAIGTGLEASVLSVAALLDAGVPQVWAKALTRAQGTILERVGAHRVVYPEFEMGRRVAHQVTGRLVDLMAVEDGFAVGEARAPASLVGRPLGPGASGDDQSAVIVVAVKRAGQGVVRATDDTVVQAGDLLILAGRSEAVAAFAAR